MKVAVISDIHDNFHNLVCFLEVISDREIQRIICLGDFINNGIARTLAHCGIPVIAIWGNNDGDKVTITRTSLHSSSQMSIGFGTYDFLELDGRKIFITHYPLLAKPMAKSGDFDAVFYGHSHKKNKDYIGKCLILNPGEISAHKTQVASFAIYDTTTNNAEIIEIDDSISVKTTKVMKYGAKITAPSSHSETHDY